VKRTLVLVAVAALALVAVPDRYEAQSASTESRLRTHVTTLASERLEGRLAGSPGERLAGEYLAGELKRIGARPLPGRSDYRLPFEFTAGTKDAGTTVQVETRGIVGGTTGDARPDPQWKAQALSFSDTGEATAPVVFAGYGLVVPDSQDFGYDSYATLDVKDKIVLVLRYFPEDADPKTKSILARYAGLRFKAMAARQRGAKAMLIVTGPRSPNAGELVPITFDTALAGSGIVAASVTGTVANRIFSSTGKTLEAAQAALDSGNPHVAGFAIPDVQVTVKTALVREQRTGYNIAGYLPATGGAKVDKPWVVVGAHYDHLGRGDHGNSLATKAETGRAHLGADDNASGTAAVLALGEAIASERRARNVALSFWSGEELGLIGSAMFVKDSPVPINQVAAYLNFDMVGRMTDNKLTVQAAGTSPVWAGLVERANVVAGFDLQLQQDPYLPTDSASFNLAGMPTLNFFTGTHSDYHKPTDTADKIAYDDLDRIVTFATTVARRVIDIPEPPAFTKVEQQTTGTSRADVRVFTGTVPDYTGDVKGLLLGGVTGGGPAERAGLQKGDVIVEIAGHTIANIYDYTYALEVLKIGEPAKVVYLREGQRRETTLTPSARK
jgi:hypothetical protein